MSKQKGSFDRKIDLEKAERLAEAGANGVQIASYFGVHPDTLYDRIVKLTEFSQFSEWLQTKKAKGDQLLLTKQFDVAMKGDKIMLIWLGKQRLNQSEKQHTVHELPETSSFSITFRNGDSVDEATKVQCHEPETD